MKDNKLDNEENDYEFEIYLFWVHLIVDLCFILLSIYLIVS